MTPKQRELSERLFGSRERGGSAMFPGLSLDKITSDLGQELKHQVAAGAHELAAALFNGHAFVMYQRNGKEDRPEHEQEHDDQHLERGGRSM